MYKYLFLSHFILLGKFQIEYQASSIGLKQHGLSRGQTCLVIYSSFLDLLIGGRDYTWLENFTYERFIFCTQSERLQKKISHFLSTPCENLFFFWKEMDYLHYTINVRGMQPSDFEWVLSKNISSSKFDSEDFGDENH